MIVLDVNQVWAVCEKVFPTGLKIVLVNRAV